jgi:hypothetical protein
VGRGTKAEGGDGTTSQPPRVGQVVDTGADFMGQRAVFKTEMPHLAAGGTDQTEL